MSKITDFLTKLESTSALQRFPVSLPIRNETISVKPLTFKQQKSLLSSGADGVRGIMLFAKLVDEVIIENAQGNLRTHDKLPIILKLRVNALGSKADSIDIEPILDRAEKTLGVFETEKTVNFEGIEMVLEYPTIERELQTINACSVALKQGDQGIASKQIDTIYAHELVKYIVSIRSAENVLNFSDVSVVDQVTVIERLPAELIESIPQFIKGYQSYEAQCIGDSKLEIDAALFIR